MKKCWICGKPGETHRNIGKTECGMFIPFDDKSQRCYCEECFDKVVAQYKADTREYIRLKKKLMFERAVRILEKQKINLYEYEEAIKAVGEFAEEQPDKFDSAYEMVAAIILINNRVECKLQFKVGRYQCDFCLPGLKVILEIDGERHRNRKEQDSIRDYVIKRVMGEDWEIIRIRTENLDKNAKRLLKAINTVLEKRRSKNAQ